MKLQFESWAGLPGLNNAVSVEVLDIPAQLDDRQMDCWEPLLAIADLAGGEWPQRARIAAVAINANRELLTSYPEMSLGDIRAVFMAATGDDATSMFTTTLLMHLNSLEERPWGTILGGSPMNASSLAKRVKDFNVKPKDVRHGEIAGRKGYRYEDFAEALERNLPPWVDPATNATDATPEAEPTQSVADVADVAANPTPLAGVVRSYGLEAEAEEGVKIVGAVINVD